MVCPSCHGDRIVKAGRRGLSGGGETQRFLCKDCGVRFSNVHKSLKAERHNSNRQFYAVLKEVETMEVQVDATGEKGLATLKGTLLQFGLCLHREGKADATIDTYTRNLYRVGKNCNIGDFDAVKEFIAVQKSENTKAGYVVSYSAFLKWKGLSWNPPSYTSRSPIPEFLPTECEIDQLIAGCGKKTATILQVLKESGMRIGEALSLKWTALNERDRILTLNTPEKRSLPRIFNISAKLLMMIQSLPKTHQRIFGKTISKDAERCLSRSRVKIAKKVGNPRLAKIHYHLIRHWFGTMEYHKTHDPDHVRLRLGHRSLLSTQIYINMEKVLFAERSDDFHVKAVSTVEEAMALLTVGFEYVTEIEGKKLFRKRK